MAESLKSAYPDIEIEMIRSSGGRFEVMLDDKLIFSKAQTGRHTSPSEILELVREQS